MKSIKKGIILGILLTTLLTRVMAQYNDYFGLLQLNDSTQLPIRFQLTTGDHPQATFMNGPEKIVADEVTVTGDSLTIRMQVFNSVFHCAWSADKSLKGYWINHNRTSQNILPFTAGLQPFSAFYRSEQQLEGHWQVDFSPNDSSNHYQAVGLFSDKGGAMTGTFLTETGDYRYLSGSGMHLLQHDVLTLSCFDGSHAFLFTAILQPDGTLKGDFYSGAHWHEPWVARRNERFELPSPDSLTSLKKGYDRIDFHFRNLEGAMVSLQDSIFRNKVVIVQIMGSWCPNCMDETRMLEHFYKQYHAQGLEVVALAFEKTKDSVLAKANVNRFKTRLGADYPFLLTGDVGIQEASDAFPMLHSMMAFPTCIYLDRQGKVKKISTGFNGPGTGIYYTRWMEQTDLFLQQLLSE